MPSRWTGDYIIKELIAKYGSIDSAIKNLQYYVDNDYNYEILLAGQKEQANWSIGIIAGKSSSFYENHARLTLTIVMPGLVQFDYQLADVEFIRTLSELGSFDTAKLVGMACFVDASDNNKYMPQFRGLWLPSLDGKRVELKVLEEFSD